MEAELVSLGANVALKEMITHFTKKLLAGNWTKDLEEGRTILQQLSQDGAAGRYVEKYVSKHLKMRTLHSAESDVYIDEVYTPLTLEVTSNKDRLKVKDGFTLEFSRIINKVFDLVLDGIHLAAFIRRPPRNGKTFSLAG